MIRLEQITGKNIWDILKLEVGEDQKNFVAPNDRSIIEPYVALTRNGQAFPFGIWQGIRPGSDEKDYGIYRNGTLRSRRILLAFL